MFKSLIFYTALFCLSFSVQAQYTITGKVFNITDISPIPLCNVYIVGTTLGAASDAQGNFSFQVPSKGNYELVYSHISYTPQLISISVSSDTTQLDPMPLDLLTQAVDEVVVTGKTDRKWKRQYNRFIQYIMGKHYRESRVKIHNPYVVEFKSIGKGMLSEVRPFSLKMRNNFTGYEIDFLVQRLFMSKSNQFMVGYPGFTPLEPESDEQKNRWEKNRERSYNGSLRHIFKSILNNSTEPNGFSMQLTEKDPVRFQGAASKILPIEVNNTINLNPQNLLTHISVSDTENPIIKRIVYKGLLNVIYLPEIDSYGNPQQTYIELTEEEFLVYTNGIPVNPTSLKLYGYLASEGLYEMLPFNY